MCSRLMGIRVKAERLLAAYGVTLTLITCLSLDVFVDSYVMGSSEFEGTDAVIHQASRPRVRREIKDLLLPFASFLPEIA